MNRWNSTFKSKPTVPLKRSRIAPGARKGKKPRMARHRLDTVGKLKKQLWELCKQITRAKYRNKDGTFNCFTCSRLIDNDAKAQTGHCIPSASGGALLRYHLDNLRIQDYYCNINLGGNGSAFFRNLILELGTEKVETLFKLRGQTVKADRLFYANKISEYQELLKVLQSKVLLPWQ